MAATPAHRVVRTMPEARTPIRVMIVDDSIVARAVLARIMSGADDIEIVAQSGSGMAALAALKSTPTDIILLDLNMPGLSGLDVLPALIDAGQGARVLVVSTVAGDGAENTLTALRLGAADTLLKPAIGGAGGDFAQDLLERLRRIAGKAATPATIGRAVRDRVVPMDHRPIACVAIGASTGGVHALSTFFADYPAHCDAPILVTQHLPPAFMPHFVSQLASMSGRPTRLAADGMMLKPATVILAPGDASISLMRTRGAVHVRLERQRSPSGYLPSVDPMLAAVARIFGSEGVGVVLSGMGRDGLVGAKELFAAGGEVLAQDAESSVVWGMPGVVSDAGIAALVGAPALLADSIAQRAARQR